MDGLVMKNIKIRPGRMYNIAFPLMIVPPLVAIIAIIFFFPFDTALKVLPMVSKSSLEAVHRITGSTTGFKLLDVASPGRLSTFNK
jgi:hypothetical protein